VTVGIVIVHWNDKSKKALYSRNRQKEDGKDDKGKKVFEPRRETKKKSGNIDNQERKRREK